MRKMEIFEELKRDMMTKIMNKNQVPEEVITIVEQAFEGLENQYRQLGCNNFSIQEYLQGALAEAKAYIEQRVGNSRQVEQAEQVAYILKGIERELQEAEEEMNHERQEQRHRENIKQIKSSNTRQTSTIMGVVGDTLKDVQSRQNRILAARGYSDEEIERIAEETRGFIRFFESRNEGKIYEALEQDDQTLQNQFLSEYETFLQQCQMTQRDEFKKRLDVKEEFDLEKQQKVTGEILEEQEKSRQNGARTGKSMLPDNPIL